MIDFPIGTCPHCGAKQAALIINNNPLLKSTTICFDCLSQKIDYNNLNQVDFFCRTFNYPFNPDLWVKLADQVGKDVFKEYITLILEDEEMQPNLYYTSSTKDLWMQVNKEWEKNHSYVSILRKLAPIKDGYVDRGRVKWGEQYTFEELLKLDSIYSRTVRANNITNPLQKEAVKTLCKIQIEIDEAIKAKDARAMKDFSTAYSTFAKQADLETMINETKTDDITTVAELFDFMEKNGFKFKFYDNLDRDEIDFAIKDIQEANRRLILESTGLQTQLEEMIRKRQESAEAMQTSQAAQAGKQSLEDLFSFTPEDGEIDTEDDAEAENLEIDTDTSTSAFDAIIDGANAKVKRS